MVTDKIRLNYRGSMFDLGYVLPIASTVMGSMLTPRLKKNIYSGLFFIEIQSSDNVGQFPSTSGKFLSIPPIVTAPTSIWSVKYLCSCLEPVLNCSP